MLPNNILAKIAISLEKLSANKQIVKVISSKYKILEKLHIQFLLIKPLSINHKLLVYS